MSDEKTYLKIEIPDEKEDTAATAAEKTRLNELGDRMADATRQLGEQAAATARQVWQEKGRPAVSAGLKWSGQKAAEQTSKVTAAVAEKVTAEIKREAAEMPAKLSSDNVKQTAAVTARRSLHWLSQTLAHLSKRLSDADSERENAGKSNTNHPQE